MKFPNLVVKPPNNPIILISKNLRDGLISFYEKTLPESSAGLLIGIVLGVKTAVSSTMQESLQNTGITYIIAASGMNVTLVAGVLLVVLQRFFKRHVGISIALIAVLWYVLISGVQPSILRAGLMISLRFGGQILGRQYNGWYGNTTVGTACG